MALRGWLTAETRSSQSQAIEKQMETVVRGLDEALAEGA